VDRILEEFSRRYWDCNPGSLFGNPGGLFFHILALHPLTISRRCCPRSGLLASSSEHGFTRR